MGHWDRSAGTIFCLHPLFTSTRRKRATVNPAVWQSLQVCSEAEKCCNKQVLLPSITPFILHLKCSGLLALLSVKSPSSCLTLLREHDRHPCHLKWLQHSDAPNLSFRQVNLWIIYFYVVSKYVDSSQVTSPMQAGRWGGQDSLLLTNVRGEDRADVDWPPLTDRLFVWPPDHKAIMQPQHMHH